MAKPQTPFGPDRPLSKAYLRQFGGWSTAYPPGMSDPNTLREMENMDLTRDGAVRVRPGLRPLLEAIPSAPGLSDPIPWDALVGEIEPFFTDTGDHALLFAVREADNTVGFRIAVEQAGQWEVRNAIDNVTIDGSEGYFPRHNNAFSRANYSFPSTCTYVTYAQIDNDIYAFSGVSAPVVFETAAMYVRPAPAVGDHPPYTRTAAVMMTASQPGATWRTSPDNNDDGTGSWDDATDKVTNSTTTLVSTTSADNIYNLAFWYTFTTPFGETAPGVMKTIKIQRPLSGWNFNSSDPAQSVDQLIVAIPNTEYMAAWFDGATGWNMYFTVWAEDETMPVEGVRFDSGVVDNITQAAGSGWGQLYAVVDVDAPTMATPSQYNRNDSTDLGHPVNGLVAGDRLVLVRDQEAPARIKWSSNQLGEYGDFSPSLGGGYKTLTSGNLYVPACAVLWQNPQSVDTITILCDGVDGRSTSYYMAPASVTGLTGATQVMGFEETTATPGTVSPFGVEVLNNALYHPLDMELMKSTASNYNLNHKTMTELIQNKWIALQDKQQIVSAHFDNKLYYLVNNPEGVALQDGESGNEVWVCDTAKDGTWARWLTPGVSLSVIREGGQLYLALNRLDGIYLFDPAQRYDERRVDCTTTPVRGAISWLLRTNTQGANRAHDMASYVKKMSVVFGNFLGQCEYGVTARDLLGREIDKSKIFKTPDLEAGEVEMQRDVMDHFELGLRMIEWEFYAKSRPGTESSGEICYVQYMLMPESKNVEAEYGSTQTFEYARASSGTMLPSTTVNGVPTPFADVRVP